MKKLLSLSIVLLSACGAKQSSSILLRNGGGENPHDPLVSRFVGTGIIKQQFKDIVQRDPSDDELTSIVNIVCTSNCGTNEQFRDSSNIIRNSIVNSEAARLNTMQRLKTILNKDEIKPEIFIYWKNVVKLTGTSKDLEQRINSGDFMNEAQIRQCNAGIGLGVGIALEIIKFALEEKTKRDKVDLSRERSQDARNKYLQCSGSCEKERQNYEQSKRERDDSEAACATCFKSKN